MLPGHDAFQTPGVCIYDYIPYFCLDANYLVPTLEFFV